MTSANRRSLLALSLIVATTVAMAQTTAATQEASGTSIQAIPENKVLVTFNPLPPEGAYEVIGPISVFKRWFGGTGAAMTLLGEKARSLGANAVVESKVWLAPAFPAQVAPHGSGIAIRVKDPALLKALADAESTWE
jgi:hypothetical protein